MDKRKKLFTILIVTVVEVAVAIWLAYIIHQYITWMMNLGNNGNYTAPRINGNYFDAVQSVTYNPGCKLWFLLLQVLYGFWIVYLLLFPHAKIQSVREMRITDQISIPIPVGNGQHGKERLLTDSEKDKVFDCFVFSGTEKPKKSGVVIEMKKTAKGELIRFVGGPSSAIVIGATRSGKTRRVLLETLWMQLMSGRSVVLSDVKGEIFYYTSKYAASLGYNIITVDLRSPKKSASYNFLQPVINALQEGDRAQAIDYTWDLVSVLVGELKGEPLWHNGESATLAAAILAVCMEATPEGTNYRDQAHNLAMTICDLLYSVSTSGAADESRTSAELQNQLWEVETNLLCGYAEPYLKAFANNDALITSIETFLQNDLTCCKNMTNVYYFLAYMGREDANTGKTPLSLYLDTLPDNHPAKTVFLQGQIAAERTRSSFYTSALGTLKLFTNPNIAGMTAHTDFELSSIGNKKTVVYLIIPDEKRTFYPLASILIQQIYMELVRIANEHGGRLTVPCDFDLDEVGNFPTIPVLGPMVTAGQSRGVRVNLVIQDYQQLESKYKDDCETIKSNCAVKIYLKSDSPKTLKEISDYLGKYTVEVTSASASTNYARSKDGSISNSSNMGGRELLMPAEIAHITSPYALVMNQGTYSAITVLPDLSKYKVNRIWGLGDEEHNRLLIEEREQERIEREAVDVPLWGIWIKFKKMLEEEAANSVTTLSFLN